MSGCNRAAGAGRGHVGALILRVGDWGYIVACSVRAGMASGPHPILVLRCPLLSREDKRHLYQEWTKKNRCDMTLAGGDQASLCLKPCLVCTTSQKTHSFELDTVLLLILRYLAHAHTAFISIPTGSVS